jgi:hypothetical protein
MARYWRNRFSSEPAAIRSATPATPTGAHGASACAGGGRSGLVFGGVIITAEVKKAYLFSKPTARDLGERGRNLHGWTVQSIHAASARLSQANRSIELHLYPQGRSLRRRDGALLCQLLVHSSSVQGAA